MRIVTVRDLPGSKRHRRWYVRHHSPDVSGGRSWASPSHEHPTTRRSRRTRSDAAATDSSASAAATDPHPTGPDPAAVPRPGPHPTRTSACAGTTGRGGVDGIRMKVFPHRGEDTRPDDERRQKVDDSWPHLLRLGALVVALLVVALLLLAWLNQIS